MNEVNDAMNQVNEKDRQIKESVKDAVDLLKETVEKINGTMDLEKDKSDPINSKPHDNDDTSLKRNLKIGFIFLLSVYDGIVESTYGPSMADYQCIYNESQQRTSLLYPILLTLNAVGTVTFLLFRNRVDPYTLGVVCMVVSCMLLVILPLLPSLWLALVVTGVIGLSTGVAGHARLVESGQLGKTSVIPLHLFPLGLCTGSFIAPLIISPFLGVSNTWRRNQMFVNSSGPDNLITPMSMYINTTLSEGEVNKCNNFSSGILYSFLVFLGGALIIAFIYVILRDTLKSDINISDSNIGGEKARVTFIDIVFLALLGVLVIIGASSNFIFGNLLSTFGIHSKLKITPNVMALMMSTFFGTTLVGRIVGTLFSLALKQITVQVVCLLGSVGASITLVFIAEMNIASLWATTTVLAFVYAPLFGAVIAWSTEVSKAKHILYGLIIVADIAGSSLIAFLIGQLMNNVDNYWLIYCMLGICVLQVALLFVMYVVSKFMDNSHGKLFC